MINPDANIVAIDYDPGASEVNQLNRIKLMLSTAQKKLRSRRIALLLLVGTRRSRGSSPFPAWTTLLSVCTNCICRLWLFKQPAFMRRPWRITPRPCVHAWALLVFVCNSTDSKQLRICGQGQKHSAAPGSVFDNFPLFYVHMLHRCTRLMLAS